MNEIYLVIKNKQKEVVKTKNLSIKKRTPNRQVKRSTHTHKTTNG